MDWITSILPDFMRTELFSDALIFFIHDIIKIFVLLAVIIFTVSIIRSFLPPEKIRKILTRRGNYTSHILAATLGIFTPFCTCSAIPLFLGFVRVGVPLGATFSFLVASPMINEVALALLIGVFGWKIALAYVASGLCIAIVSGIVIGRLKLEHLLIGVAAQGDAGAGEDFFTSWRERIEYARDYTREIIKKVWAYIFIGVGIGAFIHGYVPADFLARYIGAGNWYGVLVAVLVGVPLYSNAAGIIPVVGALTQKGVALGTTLAFMMSVIGLSLPEFIILKQAMKPALIMIFVSIVTCGIIFTGYMFNFIAARF